MALCLVRDRNVSEIPTPVSLDLRAWREQSSTSRSVGEWKFGVGRGSDNVVMITLGTGLGPAAVVEGQLIRGKHGQAVVHKTVRYGGRDCSCGYVDCAKAEASTEFLGGNCDLNPDSLKMMQMIEIPKEDSVLNLFWSGQAQ